MEFTFTFVSETKAWEEFKKWERDPDAAEAERWIRLLVYGAQLADAVGSSDAPYDSARPFGTMNLPPVYQLLEIIACIRYDDVPEVFSDDEGMSVITFTAHSYLPYDYHLPDYEGPVWDMRLRVQTDRGVL